MTIKSTIAEIEDALEKYGQDRVRLSAAGELIILDAPEPPPPRARRTTHTFSTTDVVLFGGAVYAADFSHETQLEAPERVGLLIDPKHFRKFVDAEGECAMHHFTMWLQAEGAVVGKCWNLGETLSDAERKA